MVGTTLLFVLPSGGRTCILGMIRFLRCADWIHLTFILESGKHLKEN